MREVREELYGALGIPFDMVEEIEKDYIRTTIEDKKQVDWNKNLMKIKCALEINGMNNFD